MKAHIFTLALALPVMLGTTSAFAERGSDGDLKILSWQAISTLNPYLSGGTKEQYASSVVLEPLARYDETGKIVPALAETIPSVENGGISKDLMSITWKLKSGIKWSDGTDFTADDVAFTWQYCTAPGGGCAAASYFDQVAKVEAQTPLTVKITFSNPKPFPFSAFVGAMAPILQKKQFEPCMGAKASSCTAQNFAPNGTGPFMVKDFKANDVVTFDANPYYRDPAKPAFSSLTIKGGGDPTSAASAVLETGEFDYAWFLQLEPEVLKQMEAAGKGTIVASFGTQVERIDVNPFANGASLGAKRSTVEAGPNPVLNDPAVRKALSMAIDRDLIVEAVYGKAGQPTCNILPAPAVNASTAVNWCLKPDVDGANKLLDDAGWTLGSDGVRAKNGVRLSLVFQTSTNSVRQSEQALLKDMWSQIGVQTELRNINPSIFFGGDAGNPDTIRKFYADIEMFSNNFPGTDPEAYMAGWTCNKIPNDKNAWQGANSTRYCSKDYDQIVAELSKTPGEAARGALAKKLNNLLVNDGAIIPLVYRGEVAARSISLDGVRMTSWDSQLWNIADWSRHKK